MPNQMITEFIFYETLASHRAENTHFTRGEGWELKEIGSDSFAAKDRKDKAENYPGKFLAMKAIDQQPWRDACLLPSLGYLRSQRETSAMRTVLLTSSVIVAGFAGLSTHSCYGTS